MTTLNVRGASLEFSQTGDGEALVLVHGSVSDYRTWAHLQPRFGRHFRTIVYSRRYHWPNEGIPGGADYSMNEQVEDLATLIREARAEPAHVVGHSYGAYLGPLLAIRSPGSIRSLVLAEPPVLPLVVNVPPKPQELLRLLLTQPKSALGIIKFGAKGMEPARAAFRRGDSKAGMRIFGSAVLGKEYFRKLSEERLEQVRANLIEAEFLGSGFAPLKSEEVSAIRHPVLLLHSEHGPGVFRVLVGRLQELIPGARLCPDPGRFPHHV